MNDPATHRNADRQPTHPGAILREDVLPSLGMAVSTAAEMLGVSRQMLHRVLSERAAITPEMAVRIGTLCGNGPRLWLAMQQAHGLWHAERHLAEQVGYQPCTPCDARPFQCANRLVQPPKPPRAPTYPPDRSSVTSSG
jgi:antitoxin HigA-1